MSLMKFICSYNDAVNNEYTGARDNSVASDSRENSEILNCMDRLMN
jgi:hypothetical protein